MKKCGSVLVFSGTKEVTIDWTSHACFRCVVVGEVALCYNLLLKLSGETRVSGSGQSNSINDRVIGAKTILM